MYRVISGVSIIEANRFSVFTRNANDLTAWHDDFVRAGIPAVIVLTDRGYALYRTGMEPLSDEDE